MGKAANFAFENLHSHLSGNMHACLIVKDPDNNLYHHNNFFKNDLYSSYDGASNADHVETQLMQKLYARFNGFNNIPNNSTIIFAAKWSPCQKCTTVDIPAFMKELDSSNRNLNVKFRFEKYYSKENWPHNNLNRWENSNQAQEAYDRLSAQYACLWKDVVFFEEHRVLRQKGKRKLVIAPISQATTSIIADSVVN
jgi:hypothetical protein